MLIKLLLLLAIGLKQATAICFHNKTSNVKRHVVGRPKAVDDYHCKIMCVEETQCLTYIFPEDECFLLGDLSEDAYTTCIKSYYEWVKKTDDGDCPDVIPEPKIDDEYKPNPALALARNATLPAINFEEPCSIDETATIMDTILPNNSHLVQGIASGIIMWDGKLGSWQYIIQTHIVVNGRSERDKQITTYMRAAKCFAYKPSDFSDPATCGAELPVKAIPDAQQSSYEFTGPAKYGPTVEDMCSTNQLMYATETSPGYGYATNAVEGIVCIDGQWFIPSTPSSKLSFGICVKQK